MFLVRWMQKYTEISHSKNEKNWIKPWKVIFVSVSVVSQNSKLRENWFKVSKLIFSRLKHSFHELNCSKLTRAIADSFSLLIMVIFLFLRPLITLHRFLVVALLLCCAILTLSWSWSLKPILGIFARRNTKGLEKLNYTNWTNIKIRNSIIKS